MYTAAPMSTTVKRAAPVTTAAPEPLLTVPDVARILRVHEMSVRRYIRNGALPAVRWGACVRVTHATLKAFLADAAARKCCAARDPRRKSKTTTR